MKRTKTSLIGFVGLFAMWMIVWNISGCKSCNKPTPTASEKIEKASQPEKDSLEKTNVQLRSEYDTLQRTSKRLNKERIKIGKKLTNTLTAGNQNYSGHCCDSLKLALDTVISEWGQYVLITDRQIMYHDSAFVKAQEEIRNTKRLLELERANFKTLSKVNDSLTVLADSVITENAFLTKELETSDRKLRRSRKVNSVAVPAIIVGAISIIAPKYTLPAIGVAAGVHFILKPKKKKL